MKCSMEGRIKDHKFSFKDPVKPLFLLERAMQDSFIRLESLKTTFTEMRVGVTQFQRFYLEMYGLLNYMEICRPRMDGERPPAETIMNCVGAITNVARTAQDFHTAGLPVWFLRPSTAWDSSCRCNILKIVNPLNPADILCVSEHFPPFPAIYYGSANDPKKQNAIHTHSRYWLAFKDPFGGSKGQSIELQPNSSSNFFQRLNIFNYIRFI
jgi:hypothetical protein